MEENKLFNYKKLMEMKCRSIAISNSKEHIANHIATQKDKDGRWTAQISQHINFETPIKVSKKELTKEVVNWGKKHKLSGRDANMKAYKINGYYFQTKLIDIINVKNVIVWGFFDIGYGKKGCHLLVSDIDETVFLVIASLHNNE